MFKRLFFAVAVSSVVRDLVSEIQKELGEKNKNVRWVKGELLHITLHFLGNTPSDKIGDLCLALKEAAKDISSFKITTDRVNALPNINNARVLYLGVKENDGQLTALHSSLVKALASRNFLIDNKPWFPHITIGRLRIPQKVDVSVRNISGLECDIANIALVESQLNSTGPNYVTLEEIILIK